MLEAIHTGENLMTDIINSIRDFFMLLPTLRVTDVLDILLTAFLIYKVIHLIQSAHGVRIAGMVIGFFLLMWLTNVLEMRTINWIIGQILELGIIALVVIFQPELRRVIDRISSKTMHKLWDSKPVSDEVGPAITQTVMACDTMSQERVGALIVFERSVFLEEYEKTGTRVDARVSSELLRNIFFPKAALHDGAVIIRKGRVAAAGCVLPLTANRNLSSDLGTRHRAGVGMSEVSDAVVVIVSEETGTISVAVSGMLKRHLAPQTLEKLLHMELAPDMGGKRKKFWNRVRSQIRRKDD